MKFRATVLFYWWLTTSSTTMSDAFVIPPPRSSHAQRTHEPRQSSARRRAATTTSSSSLYSSSSFSSNGGSDLSEFDYLLQESATTSELSTTQQQQQVTSVSRRRIALPARQNDNTRTTVLASSFAGPSDMSQTQQALEQAEAAAEQEADPYADALDSQLGKIQQFQERQEGASPSGLASKFSQMDLQDIIITLIVPGIALFAAGRWGFNRINSRVQENKDDALDAFCREMLYHDGDFKEMELCIAEYSRKLMWMGLAKKDAMLKRYLEAYAKKKTISPQAIASLSYVFTVFKLSEEKAASILVQTCRDMGSEKISSAGKLLFLGSRILRSPVGMEGLLPIKDMIKGTYRDAEVAETLVETSQHAIAEASYRATVQAGGRNQKSLTVGWEVLGLDQETAERIYDEEAAEGFVSDRETMYGGQTQRYDKKGRKINKDGSLEDPEEAGDDEDDDEEDGPVSNVYECTECGHTLFVAQGRESKFFGEGFTCPDCGAPKSKFKARDDMDE